MSDGEIRIKGEGLDIRIRGASPGPRGFDLYQAAVVALVEEADTHGAEKAGGEDVAWHFYAAVLAAVARHHAAESDAADPEDVDEDRLSAGEIVERLLRDLRADGKL